MGVVLECALYLLQVGATTGQDNTAKQLVAILRGHLVPGVLDDFLKASLDNLDEASALDLTVLVDGVLQVVVNIIVVGIGRSILQLHLLGIALLHL